MTTITMCTLLAAAIIIDIITVHNTRKARKELEDCYSRLDAKDNEIAELREARDKYIRVTAEQGREKQELEAKISGMERDKEQRLYEIRGLKKKVELLDANNKYGDSSPKIGPDLVEQLNLWKARYFKEKHRYARLQRRIDTGNYKRNINKK